MKNNKIKFNKEIIFKFFKLIINKIKNKTLKKYLWFTVSGSVNGIIILIKLKLTAKKICKNVL